MEKRLYCVYCRAYLHNGPCVNPPRPAGPLKCLRCAVEGYPGCICGDPVYSWPTGPHKYQPDWFERWVDNPDDGWLWSGLKVTVGCLVGICIVIAVGMVVEWYRAVVFPYIFFFGFYVIGSLCVLLCVLVWIKEHTCDEFKARQRQRMEHRKREDYYKDDNYRRGNWRD